MHQPIELQDEQPIQQSSVENYAPQVDKTPQFDIDSVTKKLCKIKEYENEVDESFATTISSSETNKQNKALELHTAAASVNDDVKAELQLK